MPLSRVVDQSIGRSIDRSTERERERESRKCEQLKTEIIKDTR